MSRGEGNARKEGRALERLLTRRGWKHVRRTGHGASMYCFPANGARFVVVSTASSSPPISDLERKLIKLERR